MEFELHLTIANKFGAVDASLHNLLQELVPSEDVKSKFHATCQALHLKPIVIFLGMPFLFRQQPIQLQTCSTVKFASRNEAELEIRRLAERFQAHSDLRVLRMRVELECEASNVSISDEIVQYPTKDDEHCYHEIHVKVCNENEQNIDEWMKKLHIHLITFLQSESDIWSATFAGVGHPDFLVITFRAKNGSKESLGTLRAKQFITDVILPNLLAAGLIDTSFTVGDVEYTVFDSHVDLDALIISHTVSSFSSSSTCNTTLSTSSSTSSSGHNHNPARLGISIQIVEAILQHPLYIPGMTTAEVCMKVIKGITAMQKCSYAVYILQHAIHHSDTVEVSYINAANYFISHSWAYDFRTTVSCMRQLSETSSYPVFFWFDILCVNQHEDYYGVNWFSTFGHSVTVIGKTAVVLSPWRNPLPLRRSWCLWELFSTIHGGSQLEIVIPDDELPDFQNALLTALDELLAAMGTIDVRNSQATVPNDRVMILEAIERSAVNIDEINKAILGKFRVWLAQSALDQLDINWSNNNNTNNNNQIGEWMLQRAHQVCWLLLEMAQYETVRPLLHKTLTACKQSLGIQHTLTHKCFNLLCWQLIDNCCYTEAKVVLGNSLSSFTQEYGPQHVISLKAGTWQLRLLHETGLLQEAEIFGRQLLVDCQATISSHAATNTAATVVSEAEEIGLEVSFLFGKLLLDLKQYPQAITLLQEAITGCDRIMPKHWVKLSATMFLGRALTETNRLQQAEDILKPALTEAIMARGERHKVTLYAKSFLSALLCKQHRYQEAGYMVPWQDCVDVLGDRHWLSVYCLEVLQTCSAHGSGSDNSSKSSVPMMRTSASAVFAVSPTDSAQTIRLHLESYLNASRDATDHMHRLRYALEQLRQQDTLTALLSNLLADEIICEKNASMSHDHQNGFAKIVLMQSPQFSLRLHIWQQPKKTGKVMQQEAEVHHHRWDFASAILHGEYEQEFWRPCSTSSGESGERMLCYQRQHDDRSHANEEFTLQTEPVTLFKWFTGRMHAGDVYVLHHDQLHRTLIPDDHSEEDDGDSTTTITLILHGPNISKTSTMYSHTPISLDRQTVSYYSAQEYSKKIQSMLQRCYPTFANFKRQVTTSSSGRERSSSTRNVSEGLLAAAALEHQPSSKGSSKKQVLILLSGKKASGKDYVGSKIVEALRSCGVGVTRHPQAIMSKKIYAQTHPEVDYRRLVLDRAYKEVHRAGVTKIYQENIARDPDYFERKTLQTITTCGSEVIVITDFRRLREYDFFCEHFHSGEVVCVRINASEEVRIRRGYVPEDLAAFAAAGVAQTSLLLETELDDFDEWSLVLQNDGHGEEGAEYVQRFIHEQVVPLVSRSLGRKLDFEIAELFR